MEPGSSGWRMMEHVMDNGMMNADDKDDDGNMMVDENDGQNPKLGGSQMHGYGGGVKNGMDVVMSAGLGGARRTRRTALRRTKGLSKSGGGAPHLKKVQYSDS